PPRVPKSAPRGVPKSAPRGVPNPAPEVSIRSNHRKQTEEADRRSALSVCPVPPSAGKRGKATTSPSNDGVYLAGRLAKIRRAGEAQIPAEEVDRAIADLGFEEVERITLRTEDADISTTSPQYWRGAVNRKREEKESDGF